jgi:hypothetical protein
MREAGRAFRIAVPDDAGTVSDGRTAPIPHRLGFLPLSTPSSKLKTPTSDVGRTVRKIIIALRQSSRGTFEVLLSPRIAKRFWAEADLAESLGVR